MTALRAMWPRLGFVVAWLAAVTCAMAALPAAATTSLPPPVVGVVDAQKILQESLAAKTAQKQIDTQRSKFQNETEKEENALRQAEQDLAKIRDTAPASVSNDREQQLRQHTLTVERHFEARRKLLDQAFADAKNVLNTALQDIVQDVAHEHGLNMVLLKQQMMWNDPALDITTEVLDRLNKKLPQVTLKIDEDGKP